MRRSALEQRKIREEAHHTQTCAKKSVRLIVERHYIGNVPMNTLFQRLAEEEIRKTAESYLAAG